MRRLVLPTCRLTSLMLWQRNTFSLDGITMSSLVIAIFLLSIGASFVQRVLPADIRGGHNTLRTSCNHDFSCHRLETEGLCHMETAMADTADVYCCLDNSHLCFDPHRRPHIEADFGSGIDSHQYLFCAVQPEDQTADNKTSAGRCWYTQRTDGRLLWHARPASRALLHPIRTH